MASSIPPNTKKFSSEDYKKWGANIHGDYFDENIESLISMKPIVRAENNEQDERVNPPISDDHDVQIVDITQSLEVNKRKSVPILWKRVVAQITIGKSLKGFQALKTD